MSKADKVFKRLGYIKKEVKFKGDIDTIEYRQTTKDEVYDEVIRIIELNNPKFYEYPIINLCKILKNIHSERNVDLSLQEIQAINEKCKELGWIE